MEADAVSIPLAAIHAAATLARPGRMGVQSSSGMAATRAIDGANRGSSGRDDAGRHSESQMAERAQNRALEMDLIREAQGGSRAAFDVLVRQYEHQVLRLALHLTGSEHDAE